MFMQNMQDFMQDDGDPTPSDEGRFLAPEELQEWFDGMKQRSPQVFRAEDSLFGPFDSIHGMGQKLTTYFDDDPSRPMKCEVRGMKWTRDIMYFKQKCPMYVIKINGELSMIPFTSAHEKSGWWRGWDVPPPAGWFD